MIPQDIINLYDEYTHKPLTRKTFIKRLIVLVGSSSAAMSVLPLLESNYSKSVSDIDAGLKEEYIRYEGVNGPMNAYVARPLEDKKYPAIVVIHENRGLTPHIEDVARRAAMDGFLAIAPDALSPLGLGKIDEDEARKRFSELKSEDNIQNFIRVFEYLKSRTDFDGKVGCVGFCWGGLMANNLATMVPSLQAAVAFYGKQPDLDKVGQIKCALQLHYAEMDERVNAGVADYETALISNQVNFEIFQYPGVQHAFHNDTSAARYNEPAAKLAWERTITCFKKYLK